MKWEQWQAEEEFSAFLPMEGLTKLFPFEAPKQTFCSLMGIATDAPGAAALRMVAVVILCPMNCTQIVVHQPGSS